MNRYPEFALAIVRIVLGVTMLAHGSQKLFQFGIAGVAGAMAQMGIPSPQLSAVLLTAAEFGGGLLLLAGLFSRLAAIPVAFAMLVAMFAVHLKGGFFAPAGIELTLALAAMAVTVVLAGPGAFALDNVVARGAAPRLVRHPA